jgi:hypothetical protein
MIAGSSAEFARQVQQPAPAQRQGIAVRLGPALFSPDLHADTFDSVLDAPPNLSEVPASVAYDHLPKHVRLEGGTIVVLLKLNRHLADSAGMEDAGEAHKPFPMFSIALCRAALAAVALSAFFLSSKLKLAVVCCPLLRFLAAHPPTHPARLFIFVLPTIHPLDS